MELKDYLAVIKKNILFIAVLVAIGAFLGLYASRILPSGYQASRVYFVSEREEESEGFSPQQPKAINFTDSAVSVLSSPDFQRAVPVTGSVEAKKLAPQVIRITVATQDPSQSSSELENLIQAFNNQTPRFLNDDSISLVPVGESSDPTYFALSPKVLAIFGALIGLISSLAIIAVVNYLKL